MDMRMIRWCAAAGVLAVCSCTFNVEETTQTLGWTRDLSGVRSVALDQKAFGGCGVRVAGVDTERLALSCDLRRLVTEGSEPAEDVQLQVSREDDSVTLALAVSGEDWVAIAVDSVRMELGRWFDLDIGNVEGGVEVLNYAGFVTGQTQESDIRTMTEAGADLVSSDGNVTVTVTSDSVFEGVTVVTRNGDITVWVPAGLAATFDLSTRSGDIEVLERHVSGSEYDGWLNGGGGMISCETSGGDIEVDTLPGT